MTEIDYPEMAAAYLSEAQAYCIEWDVQPLDLNDPLLNDWLFPAGEFCWEELDNYKQRELDAACCSEESDDIPF